MSASIPLHQAQESPGFSRGEDVKREELLRATTVRVAECAALMDAEPGDAAFPNLPVVAGRALSV